MIKAQQLDGRSVKDDDVFIWLEIRRSVEETTYNHAKEGLLDIFYTILTDRYTPLVCSVYYSLPCQEHVDYWDQDFFLVMLPASYSHSLYYEHTRIALEKWILLLQIHSLGPCKLHNYKVVKLLTQTAKPEFPTTSPTCWVS